jgi:hypothetical protein
VKRIAALVVIALGASLALSACGTPEPADTGSHSSHTPSDMTRDNEGRVRQGG